MDIDEKVTASREFIVETYNRLRDSKSDHAAMVVISDLYNENKSLQDRLTAAESELSKLQNVHLNIDGQLLAAQHDLEMERGVGSIYLNTLAAAARLLKVDIDDHDVLTPIENLISERDQLRANLEQSESTSKLAGQMLLDEQFSHAKTRAKLSELENAAKGQEHIGIIDQYDDDVTGGEYFVNFLPDRDLVIGSKVYAAPHVKQVSGSDELIGYIHEIDLAHLRETGKGKIHRDPIYDSLAVYAQPSPNKADVPPVRKVTDYGQINEGDLIILDFCGKRLCVTANQVLQKGTDEEEIIYNRKKNFYFITSMILDGTSNHKNVYVVESLPPLKDE